MSKQMQLLPMSQVLVSDFHDGMRGWRCDFIVVEKCHETLTTTDKRVQKVILADREGGKVVRTLWNDAIDCLHTSIMPYKRYRVGGVTASRIKLEHLRYSPGIMYEITIPSIAFILPLTDAEPQIPHPPMTSMSFADMISAINTERRADILFFYT